MLIPKSTQLTVRDIRNKITEFFPNSGISDRLEEDSQFNYVAVIYLNRTISLEELKEFTKLFEKHALSARTNVENTKITLRLGLFETCPKLEDAWNF